MTGHYWLSLAAWLKNRSLEVVLVNPHLVKKNKENRDNTPSKVTGSLATLRLLPTPADLQKLTVRQVVDGWKTVMKRQSGERRAGELLALAARSVGAKPVLPQALFAEV